MNTKRELIKTQRLVHDHKEAIREYVNQEENPHIRKSLRLKLRVESQLARSSLYSGIFFKENIASPVLSSADSEESKEIAKAVSKDEEYKNAAAVLNRKIEYHYKNIKEKKHSNKRLLDNDQQQTFSKKKSRGK